MAWGRASAHLLCNFSACNKYTLFSLIDQLIFPVGRPSDRLFGSYWFACCMAKVRQRGCAHWKVPMYVVWSRFKVKCLGTFSEQLIENWTLAEAAVSDGEATVTMPMMIQLMKGKVFQRRMTNRWFLNIKESRMKILGVFFTMRCHSDLPADGSINNVY